MEATKNYSKMYTKEELSSIGPAKRAGIAFASGNYNTLRLLRKDGNVLVKSAAASSLGLNHATDQLYWVLESFFMWPEKRSVPVSKYSRAELNEFDNFLIAKLPLEWVDTRFKSLKWLKSHPIRYISFTISNALIAASLSQFLMLKLGFGEGWEFLAMAGASFFGTRASAKFMFNVIKGYYLRGTLDKMHGDSSKQVGTIQEEPRPFGSAN